MARTQVATDNFTGYTNGAFPTSNWTNLDGNNGELRIIASGQIGSTYSAFSTMRRSAGSYTADQYAGITMQGITGTQTGSRIGVCLRASADASPIEDSYILYFDDGATSGTRSVYYDRINNGTKVNLAVDTATTWASGDILWGELTGVGASVLLTAYQNATPIAALTAFGDSNANRIVAAGAPGAMANQASTVYISAWEGGNITAGSSGSMIMRDRRVGGGMGPEMNGGMSASSLFDIVFAEKPKSIFLPPRALLAPQGVIVHRPTRQALEARP